MIVEGDIKTERFVEFLELFLQDARQKVFLVVDHLHRLIGTLANPVILPQAPLFYPLFAPSVSRCGREAHRGCIMTNDEQWVALPTAW